MSACLARPCGMHVDVDVLPVSRSHAGQPNRAREGIRSVNE